MVLDEEGLAVLPDPIKAVALDENAALLTRVGVFSVGSRVKAKRTVGGRVGCISRAMSRHFQWRTAHVGRIDQICECERGGKGGTISILGTRETFTRLIGPCLEKVGGMGWAQPDNLFPSCHRNHQSPFSFFASKSARSREIITLFHVLQPLQLPSPGWGTQC